jgi:integrase
MKFKAPEPAKVLNYDLFSDCILIYSDWLENVDVPKHEQKQRSSKYIKETVEYVTRFKNFLKDNGYNLNKLTIYDVDKYAYGKYYEYLECKVKSVSTFNHNLRAIKNFYNFLVNEKGYLIPNLPKKTKLKYENPDPKSIDDNDFIKLLNAITEGDSIHIYPNGTKKNMYRPFIKESFELAAYTGMRLEEVTTLKFSDIKYKHNGELDYLEGTDLKFERGHNWDKTKAKKVVYIPITPELEDLLIRLKYKEYKGSDKYLIDGDSTMSRVSLAKQMSHSFTFYKRKAGINANVSFLNQESGLRFILLKHQVTSLLTIKCLKAMSLKTLLQYLNTLLLFMVKTILLKGF